MDSAARAHLSSCVDSFMHQITMDAQQRRASSGGGLDLDEFDPNSLFFYRTAKRVKIKVWQLGLAYPFSAAAHLCGLHHLHQRAVGSTGRRELQFQRMGERRDIFTVSSDDVSCAPTRRTTTTTAVDGHTSWLASRIRREISVKEPDGSSLQPCTSRPLRSAGPATIRSTRPTSPRAPASSLPWAAVPV